MDPCHQILNPYSTNWNPQNGTGQLTSQVFSSLNSDTIPCEPPCPTQTQERERERERERINLKKCKISICDSSWLTKNAIIKKIVFRSLVFYYIVHYIIMLAVY